MLYNPLIFGLGGMLAAAYFVAPKLFVSSARPVRFFFVAALYVAASSIAFLLFDAKTAFVVFELGVAFTVIGKLLVINFEMVHTPNSPKNRRCY